MSGLNRLAINELHSSIRATALGTDVSSSLHSWQLYAAGWAASSHTKDAGYGIFGNRRRVDRPGTHARLPTASPATRLLRRPGRKHVGPAKTAAFMKELIADWKTCLRDRWAHPLIAIAATNLDFLCIHPFRDGNGRVSRLLLLLQCYHLGFEAGRFISLERLIEENKERYYETLEESSRRWHEGKHDPWPYINYVLFILKSAYKEFEKRVGRLESPKGEKAEMVLEAIRCQQGNFRLLDIEHECPGVGREWIRPLLSSLRNTGAVTCRGKGPAARWRNGGSKGTTLT